MSTGDYAIGRCSIWRSLGKLRGRDLVKLKIGDVVSGGEIRNRSTIIQQKTGRPVQFEIMSEARKSLTAWLERRRGNIQDFLFPSRVDYLGHLSTRQYARLVDEWVSTIGLDQREYGTHSLRRTKASLIYKATGNLRAVQILLGHTNIQNTVRYLGVDIDDALTLSERTEI
jgi:integrase